MWQIMKDKVTERWGTPHNQFLRGRVGFAILALLAFNGCAGYSEYVKDLNKKSTQKRQAELRAVELAQPPADLSQVDITSMDLSLIDIIGEDPFTSQIRAEF